MAHEDMVDKLDAAFQSGDVPDIYMERGGGELADHVDAGLVRDISDDAADEIAKIGGSIAGWQVDDATYALAVLHGRGRGSGTTRTSSSRPASRPRRRRWTSSYDVIDAARRPPASRRSRSAPATSGRPRTTGTTRPLRSCAEDVLTGRGHQPATSPTRASSRPARSLEDLLATEPFNPGFLTTPAQEGATSASGLLATGKVAMELQGHWEPGVMQGLTDDGKGLGDKTGWFPFPAVEGGAGDPAAQLGGGDAWAVAEGAPDEAVDLVKYLLSDEVQQGFAENDMGLPTNPAATRLGVRPGARPTCSTVRDEAPYVQLYFDTAFGDLGRRRDERRDRPAVRR